MTIIHTALDLLAAGVIGYAVGFALGYLADVLHRRRRARIQREAQS
jgi:hypothetical protein